MFIQKYLKQIGIKKIPDVNIKNLKQLHRKHLLSIPFENLDIHTGKKIILNKKHLSKKFFENKRGGYCYELNGMFYLLLKAIGFNVKMISARVNDGKGGWGAEFDHLALIVKIDNREFLTDVGFGDSFMEPVIFEINKLKKDKNGWYKIEKYNRNYFKLMKSLNKKDFTDEYIFSIEKRKWKDFEGMNLYHQTSPKSHFTKRKVFTLPRRNGRVTLSSDKLVITSNGKRKITAIKSGEFNKKLNKYFGITENQL